MLKINQLGNEVVDTYYKAISEKILRTKDSVSLNKKAKKIIYEDYLEKIVKSLPTDLITINNQIMACLVRNYNENEYFSYVDIKHKKKKNQVQKDLCKKYSIDSKLRRIFNYESFISGSKKTSYALAKSLDRNTCTYCNRLYTTTVDFKHPKTGRINDSTRITRPQFDHWFPQKYYPMLALSIYNLIPSCSVCNTSIKGDTKFSLIEHIHPYIPDEDADNFTFSFRSRDVDSYQVEIKTNNGTKIGKFISDFKIEEVYNSHADFELKDLIDLRLKYSENYLETLLSKTFTGINMGDEEIYRLIFGVEIDSENYHKRPFSKFKCDIIEELKKIT